MTDFGFASDTVTPTWISKENWNNVLFISIMSAQMKNFVITLMDNEKEWRRWYESYEADNMPDLNPELEISRDDGMVFCT